MLQGHDLALRWINENRMVHLDGVFGSGKTALAFRLAYELWKNYNYRYVVTNIQSPWNEDLENIQLRENKFVDAVFIIDEAGVFLKKRSDWDDWDFALRKLNIVLLAPSIKRLPANDQLLVIERQYNLKRVGLPCWRYGVYLDTREGNEKVYFNWWFPSEAFGLYSTDDTPIDASELAYYMKKWLADRERLSGNEQRAEQFTKQSISSGFISRRFTPANDNVGQLGQVAQLANRAVGDIEGAIDDLRKIQGKQQETLSALERKKTRKHRS